MEEPARHFPDSGVVPLTMEELIRAQLQGKSRALERYDEILWKIRAGYLAVLYGLLTVLSGKDFEIKDVLGDASRIEALLYTSIGFSLSAFFVDIGFLLSKLRVVAARNRLSDLAFVLAQRRSGSRTPPAPLKALLHLSGEAPDPIGLSMLIHGVWPVLLLYTITPVMIGVIRFWRRA